MRIIVAYDIGDNVVREAFAGYLKRIGLKRIQRSLFIGRGSTYLVKDIERMARRMINMDNDCVHIFILYSIEQTKVRVIGTPWDEARSHSIQAVEII